MIIIPDFVIWRVMNLDDGLPLLGLTLITYIGWMLLYLCNKKYRITAVSMMF